MKALDLAWSAGFLDGEGCITIRKAGTTVLDEPRYTLAVSASQMRREPLDNLQRILGGSVGKRLPYQWDVVARQAAIALEQLTPYLVNKKPEALVALEFAKIMPTHGSKLNVDRALLTYYYQRLRDLKINRSVLNDEVAPPTRGQGKTRESDQRRNAANDSR